MLVEMPKPRGRGGWRPGAGRKPASGNRPVPDGRFIYVVGEVDLPQPVKIGIASNPLKRIGGLQVANWRPLKLLACFVVADTAIAVVLERSAHDALRGLHVRGEWFAATAEAAEAVIRQAAAAIGVDVERFDYRRHLQKVAKSSDAPRVEAG